MPFQISEYVIIYLHYYYLRVNFISFENDLTKITETMQFIKDGKCFNIFQQVDCKLTPKY